MNVNALKKLAQYQKKIAQIERGLVKFNQQLTHLPARFGFKSMADFIAALRQAAAVSGAKVLAPKATKRRKRAVITADTKLKVKQLVAAKKTGQVIARTLGISLPSVQNIKKALGLVKSRR
jgi:hypothetical protein